MVGDYPRSNGLPRHGGKEKKCLQVHPGISLMWTTEGMAAELARPPGQSTGWLTSTRSAPLTVVLCSVSAPAPFVTLRFE